MLKPSRTEECIKGLVSIIIPAHQVENYIDRSVRSAIAQTYVNIEVIVIENGSTDRTPEILTTLQEKYKRFFIYQSSIGVSNARNKGIENCKGEFLLFLDADDWLENDAIEKLMCMVDEDVDLVSARYFGDRPFEDYEYKKYKANLEEYIIKCLKAPTKRTTCTGCLYRTKFIKNHKIFFDSDLNHAEDTVFFTRIIAKNPITVDLEKPLYHVCINSNSVTRKGGKDNSDEFCESIRRVYDLLSGRSLAIRNAGFACALNQILVILVNNGNSLIKQVQFIREISQKKVFAEAIRNVDISSVDGMMKYVFWMMKKQMYVSLAVITKIRAIMNARRGRKEANGQNTCIWND